MQASRHESDALREVEVPVRSRTTVGDAESSLDLCATCPVRGTEVPLADCAVCPRGAGLRIGSDPRQASVICFVEGDDGAPLSVGSGPKADVTPISAIMAHHVTCVRPDLGLDDAEFILLENGWSGLPVVDATGRPIGIVSKTDLLRARRAGGDEVFRSQRVADVMMPLAFCLPANESIARAAALMAFESVHRVPVVGSGGQVVGLVSPLDVLRWIAREHGYVLGSPG